jgi:hypothetical protein
MIYGLRTMAKWLVYACLFALTAFITLTAFMIVHMIAIYILWFIVPTRLVYAAVIFISVLLFSTLGLIARRKRSGWLGAVALGGMAVPILMIASPLLMLLLPNAPPDQKPNQHEPATSPSGRYVLTVPIERSEHDKGPLGFGMPYWHVTVSDPNGTAIYRDADEQFFGVHNIYWMWDKGDRVWLYNSDNGTVYFYEEYADGKWRKAKWGHGKTGHVPQDIAPPESLYPSYVSGGPVQNLGTSWRLSGVARGMGPSAEAMASFQNTETSEGMMLRIGETRNGITLVDADWDTKDVVVEIRGKRFTLNAFRR